MEFNFIKGKLMTIYSKLLRNDPKNQIRVQFRVGTASVFINWVVKGGHTGHT